MTNGEDLIKLDDLNFLVNGAGPRNTMPLIAFTLPSTPRSVQATRLCLQAVLHCHQLSGYADDALTVTSELVTNAIKHAGAVQFGVEIVRPASCEAVAIIVTDSSRCPPVRRYPAADTEHGRGLHIVDVLSASWGWQPHDPGKAVYAILTMQQVEARKAVPFGEG